MEQVQIRTVDNRFRGPEWITGFQEARIKATDRDQGLHQPPGWAVGSGSLQLISPAVCLRTAKEKVVRSD